MRFHHVEWNGTERYVLLFYSIPYEEKQVNINEYGFHCFKGRGVQERVMMTYEKSLILLEDVVEWMMEK